MATHGSRFSRLVRSRQGALALIVFGVVVIGAGLLQTTTSQLNGGNVPCPSGTTLVAKFEFQGGNYNFESPDGNEHAVTITSGSATGGTWDSEVAIADVIVKGGPNAVIMSFSPPSFHGVFSNDGLPLVGSGSHPDVSNVQFCAPIADSTTTTSTSTAPNSTTTPTVPSPTVPNETTTSPATESTTIAPTTESTTVPPTVAPTTVPPTVAPTSTTPTHATATTVPSSTTTSLARDAITVPTTGSSMEGATSTSPGSTAPTNVLPLGATSTSIVPVPRDAGTGSNSLPRTGSASLPLIAFGTLMLAGGAALVIVGRRRHWA